MFLTIQSLQSSTTPLLFLYFDQVGKNVVSRTFLIMSSRKGFGSGGDHPSKKRSIEKIVMQGKKKASYDRDNEKRSKKQKKQSDEYEEEDEEVTKDEEILLLKSQLASLQQANEKLEKKQKNMIRVVQRFLPI